MTFWRRGVSPRQVGVALCWLGFALFVAALALKAGPRDACPYQQRVMLPLVADRDMVLLEDTPVLLVFGRGTRPACPSLVSGRAGAPRPPPRELRLLDPAGPIAAEVRVNHPLRWRGWWIYDAGEGFVAIRDPYWPLAALGGLFALIGAACGVLFSVPRTVRAPADASSAKH